jgi:protein TonB
MFGFILSVFLHLSLVGALQFRLLTTEDWRIPTDTKHHTIEFRPPDRMLNYGIIEPPTRPGANHMVPKADGTPVPVPENLVPKDQSIRTQDERVMNVTPGADEGQSTAVGSGTVIESDEPDPKAFVYVEKYPDLVTRAVPVYPESARLAGLEGKVLVRMLVGKDGKVKKVFVEQSTFEIFNEAACEAAMKFVFTPGYMSGGPVAVWVSVPFVFKLR